MNRLTLHLTTLIALSMLLMAPPVRAQETVVNTAVFVVPSGTNSLGAANAVELENTGPLYSVWTPLSVLQNIGTATGAASTNTLTISYQPSGATSAYRIGGITAQTYGAEALSVLTSYPPLKNGDKYVFQGTALSNITYFVTYEVSAH